MMSMRPALDFPCQQMLEVSTRITTAVNEHLCVAGLTARAPLAVSGWLISPYTLNLMVPKEDTTNVLIKLVRD